jgi:fatty-acyl-CoA synthase
MNIAGWVEKWAHNTPDRPAIRFEGTTTSYADLHRQVTAHAAMLRHRLGVQRGDRIAWLGQNHPLQLIMLFACARLGAILVPLNWRLAASEHRYVLEDCGAAVLFVDPAWVAQSATLQPALPDCTFVALQDSADGDWPVLAELLTGNVTDAVPAEAGCDQPLLIIYTSGTTGFPKGAVLTHEALQYNAWNSILMHDMHSDDLILTLLPLFHVGGLNIQTTAGLFAGASILLHRAFDPAATLHAITADRCTLTIILPAHMPALQALPGWAGADLSSLRSVTTGSTMIPDSMTAFWHGRGIPLLQVYGSTETCPIAVHQTAANAFATAGSIGYAAMHSEIRLIDDSGADCAVNVPGELLVRGRHVMSGYWNNPSASSEAMKDGWFHSGDIGYRDEQGCYYFVDRKHDIIISGGENIYPAEIENILMHHPAILEAAIVGREDPRWGEVAVAVIVIREGNALDRQQVLDWLEGKLGRFKHPRDILFTDVLPRNAMRKVIKTELREMVRTAGVTAA